MNSLGLAAFRRFVQRLPAATVRQPFAVAIRGGAGASSPTVVLTLLVAVALPLLGQTETPEDRLARLIDNRDQLSITVQLGDLDQDMPPVPVANPKMSWMAGRPVQVIAYITNPTAAALEIPDPFDGRAGELELCYQVGILPNGSIQWLCGDEDSPAMGAQLDVPSRFINPSETLVVVHKSTDVVPGTEEFSLGEAGLLRSEGHYRFGYLVGI